MTTQPSRYAREPDAAHGRDADRPSAIPQRGWRDILLRVWENIDRDNVLVIAAGMAFFAFLAIPPGLTALVSLYGLLADPVDIEDQLTNLLGVLPPDAIRLVSHQLMAIAQNSSSTLSVSFVVSLGVAIWSARSGTSTLITALNIAYKEREKRRIIEFNLVALALTLCAALVSAVSLVLVAVLPAVLDFIPWRGCDRGAFGAMAAPGDPYDDGDGGGLSLCAVAQLRQMALGQLGCGGGGRALARGLGAVLALCGSAGTL